MIEKDMAFEIMATVNQLKSYIHEGYECGEVGRKEKEKIMDKLGQIKQVVLSDYSFKQSYQKEYSGRLRMIR